MDREKQIEEMAKVIDKSPWKLDQDFAGCHINSFEIAESLYNAGYRRQSEIAKEIFEEIITTIFSKMPSDILLVGKDCDFADGIRMGKREAIFDMINTLAELKKKYTDINQRKEDESNGVHI